MLTHVQYTTPPTPPPYPHTHTHTGAGAALLTDESVSASKEQAALWQLSLQTLLTWNSPSCYHSSLFFLSSLQGTFAGNPSPLSRSLSLSLSDCAWARLISLLHAGDGDWSANSQGMVTRNENSSHLKEHAVFSTEWKAICDGLRVGTRKGKQLQRCQCQDCISICTLWQKVQQLPQSPVSKYD